MSEPKSQTCVGFIGAGGIARRHVGVLRTMPDVTLAAFCDANPDAAQGLAEECGAQAFSSYDTMFDAAALDALYICVPPFAHGDVEFAALERSLPFFVEKPLSTTLDVAQRIDAAVRATGLVTAVGYHWRYLDIVDEAKAALARNPAQLVAGHWIDQTPPPAWWWHTGQSGGQVVEQATHIIDLMRHLVGEITQVQAAVAAPPHRDRFPGLDVATSTAATLTFDNGAVGTLSVTCMLNWSHRVGLHLFGDGLAIELTDRDLMMDIGQGRPVRQAGFDPVWAEDRAFIDAVSGLPNAIRSPYGEALKSHRASLAIMQSAQTSRPVLLSSDPIDEVLGCLTCVRSARWGSKSPAAPISSNTRRGHPRLGRCASRRCSAASRPAPN